MKLKGTIRPMYKSDDNYRKGMMVIVDDFTGEIIKKHFDEGKLDKESLKDSYELTQLTYNEIDWEQAGYKI